MIPQNVAYEYLRAELIGCINYGLSTLQVPPYQVEQLLKEYHAEVRAQAQQEFQQAEKMYRAEQAKKQEVQTVQKIEQTEKG